LIVGLTYQLQLINSGVFINKTLSTESSYQCELINIDSIDGPGLIKGFRLLSVSPSRTVPFVRFLGIRTVSQGICLPVSTRVLKNTLGSEGEWSPGENTYR
jgi:hypothetical protein